MERSQNTCGILNDLHLPSIASNMGRFQVSASEYVGWSLNIRILLSNKLCLRPSAQLCGLTTAEHGKSWNVWVSH